MGHPQRPGSWVWRSPSTRRRRTGPTGPICSDRTPPAMSSDTDGNGTGSEDLLREVGELRAENDRLRGLLGLDDRPVDGHSQAWAPTLLAEPTERPAVDGSSTAADKLTLFRSLFGARSDVYAYRWESASSGKTGWSPATKDRWSKGRPPRSYLPLTDEVFVSHLRGEETVGIYPLLRNDTCTLLACDFDKGTTAPPRSSWSTARNCSTNDGHAFTTTSASSRPISARSVAAATSRPV